MLIKDIDTLIEITNFKKEFSSKLRQDETALEKINADENKISSIITIVFLNKE